MTGLLFFCMAAKKTKETPNKVSDETLDQEVKLTPDGLVEGSPEAQELGKQRDFLGRIAKPSFEQAKTARRKYDQEWMARNLFWRGYQFSRYLPQTQTVVLSGRQNARVPVNLVTAYMRAIRNQVTSFRPKWETMPRDPSDENDKVQARYEGRLLDYYWDHLKLKMKTKETITQGLLYSVGGPWKIEWDKSKKKPKISLRDTFDFYIDPLAEEFNDDDPEFCIEAVRQSHSEVVHNPEFSLFARKEVAGGDNTLAASEYKQFMIQAIRTVSPRTNDNSPTVILKDGYFKRRRDDGSVYMVRVMWTDQNLTPLYYEEIDTDEFPFALYKADLNPKDVYGESWIKHVMAVNRVINSLESSAFEYNYRVAKGRIVVDKDSGVKQIHNVHGEIISKNRGSEVKALDMAPLPVAVPQQIERMWRYLEDISGLHEACVDLQTEILTTDGWKKQSDIRVGQAIISYNLDKDNLEKDKIKNVYVYAASEKNQELIAIKNKNIDAVVTKNHRWPVFTDTSRGKFSIKQFKEAQELNSTDHLILSAEYKFPTRKTYSDDFVELVGWVITEGTYSLGPKNKARGRQTIRICQSKKNTFECELIEGCLKRLGCYQKPGLMKDGMYQFGFAGETARKVRTLFPQKKLTFEFINRLTEKQANILYKTLLLGDGTEIATKTLFWSTDKENIDSFQYLCTLLGFNCRTSLFKRALVKKIYSYIRGNGVRKPLFVVSVKDQTRFTGFSNARRKEKFVKIIENSDKVWCPETGNGTFIARRNGYVFITGNSLGRIPTGVKTGVGIAELKQADATSQDDLVDNLEDFLEEVARKLLKVVSQNMDTYQIVRDLGVRAGQEKYFVAIGEQFNRKKKKPQVPGHEGQVKFGPDWFDIAEIAEDNHVRVNVGSWLGYTKEAMQQKVIQYYQLQLIDQATALRLLEFGDVDSIIQQSRIEALLKRPPQMGPDGQPAVDQYSLAMSENEMMLDGTVTTPRDAIALVQQNQDHVVHIALHQEALGRGQDNLIGVHIDAHQHFLGLGKPTSTPQQQQAAPQGPQAPTQPSAMPSPAGMPSAPAPMGAPPGQNLPQQNVPQNMAMVDQTAAQNAGGIVT